MLCEGIKFIEKNKPGIEVILKFFLGHSYDMWRDQIYWKKSAGYWGDIEKKLAAAIIFFLDICKRDKERMLHPIRTYKYHSYGQFFFQYHLNTRLIFFNKFDPFTYPTRRVKNENANVCPYW